MKAAYSELVNFTRARKKDLTALAVIFLFLLAIKFLDAEAYSESRYRLVADLCIYFGMPLGVLWEWREYRKSKE